MLHRLNLSLVLSTLTIAACALTLSLPAQAAVDNAAPAKKAPKKAKSKKVAPPVVADEEAADTKDAVQTDFNCAAGHSFSVFRKHDDNEHIALRWKQRLLRLTRVTTDTGADRFESVKHSLVWIGIPAKSMLLDAKKGQQLANDCKSAEQLKADANPATTQSSLTAPAAAPASPANLTAPAAAPATPVSQ
ncbi:MAG: hypothetical protein RL748_2307 [Pseudomonadota bacterium]|jgi:hypothetical protein